VRAITDPTDQLQQALTEWATNDQCRAASGMLSLSLELYRNTAHLLPESRAVWTAFIADVERREPVDSPYRYSELKQLIKDGAADVG
jgi:hypothetical protein